MISAIDGIIENRGSDYVTVKAGALSFYINVSTNTLDEVEAIGKRVYLYTHLHLREDNVALYGFSHFDELKLFQKLITVAGIGPRLALSLLSTFGANKLISAIINNNLDLLSTAPGVGKKMAARIVLELKGKLQKDGIGKQVPNITLENADVITALVNLGYTIREADDALSTLPGNEEMKLEEKIKLALQYLATK